MNAITIITTIKTNASKTDLMKYELSKLISKTKQENGCMVYKMYQNTNEPNDFKSFEIWTDKEAINKHLKTKYIQEFLKNTKLYTTNFKIDRYTEIV